jgi:Domain of unkown function (DUF1775)
MPGRLSVRIAVALAAAVAAAVASAAPALAGVPARVPADVTMTPDQATQTEAVRLAFRVTADGPVATTKVRLALPDATPVAEVFPLSHPDWAPGLTNRTLDQPIEAIHGMRTTEVVSTVTWSARPGWQLQPGASSALDVELGPLPEVDRLVFTVTQIHADGSAGPPYQVPLTLVPPAPGPAHGGTAAQPDDGEQQAAPDGGAGGTRLALIISVLVIGLLGGAVLGAFALPRLRRGATSLTVSPDALNAPTAEPAPAQPVAHEASGDKTDVSRR